MPGKPTRAALEPLAPALAGTALAVLLLGMLIWTLLPLVVSETSTGEAEIQQAGLVWRKPGDFIKAPSLEQPVQTAQPPPVAELKYAPAPPTPPTIVPRRQEAVSRLNAAAGALKPPSPRAAASVPAEIVGLENSISSASGMDAFPPRRMAGSLTAQIGGDLPGKGKSTGAQSGPVQAHAAAASSETVVRSPREPAKYIAVSAITKAAPQPVTAVPQPVPSLLQIAVHNEADRILAAETGGADMGAVEKALQQAMLEAWKPPSPTLVPADQRRVEVRLAVLRDGAVRDAAIHKKSGSLELDESVAKMLQKVVKISESLPVKFPGTRYSLQVNLQID